jgi:hypothetical protein
VGGYLLGESVAFSNYCLCKNIYHVIVMLSQKLLHVSAFQRHHQGARMILTSYLYVGVHYMKNNGISCEVAATSIVILWIQVDVVKRCWKEWTASSRG